MLLLNSLRKNCPERVTSHSVALWDFMCLQVCSFLALCPTYLLFNKEKNKKFIYVYPHTTHTGDLHAKYDIINTR